jgi:hypothetical protein
MQYGSYPGLAQQVAGTGYKPGYSSGYGSGLLMDPAAANPTGHYGSLGAMLGLGGGQQGMTQEDMFGYMDPTGGNLDYADIMSGGLSSGAFSTSTCLNPYAGLEGGYLPSMVGGPGYGSKALSVPQQGGGSTGHKVLGSQPGVAASFGSSPGGAHSGLPDLVSHSSAGSFSAAPTNSTALAAAQLLSSTTYGLPQASAQPQQQQQQCGLPNQA